MAEKLTRRIALIVDTNLFLECRPLNDLPWHELGYEHIELVVSQPVQRELDNHKKNKLGRTFKKALAATKLLRELITSQQHSIEIKKCNPRVELSIMIACRIDPNLNDSLDPSNADDAIILRMLQYQHLNKTTNVCLITHDTGPMATAKSLEVPFITIPDSWLMREQDDPATKEINQLRSELQRLRAQEPKFDIKAFDSNENQIDRIELVVDYYEPLTKNQIDEFMEAIEQNFPIAKDFGSEISIPKPEKNYLTLLSNYNNEELEFVPPSDDQIKQYQRQTYPQWISDCRKSLSDLDRRMNASADWPEIQFVITNNGTRPAIHSLIEFIAMGNIVIFPTYETNTYEHKSQVGSNKFVQLPKRPREPRGKWVLKSLSGLDRMMALMSEQSTDPLSSIVKSQAFNFDQFGPPKTIEPDAFYWKGGFPLMPQNKIGLTCENWRHNFGDERFGFRITALGSHEISGAIQCRIHAENLSKAEVLTIPVRIKRCDKSISDLAKYLVEQLAG